jgi:hypothetical protein
VNKERIATMKSSPELLERFRSYLTNMSWLIKSILEPIARKANAENDVTSLEGFGKTECCLVLPLRCLSTFIATCMV